MRGNRTLACRRRRRRHDVQRLVVGDFFSRVFSTSRKKIISHVVPVPSASYSSCSIQPTATTRIIRTHVHTSVHDDGKVMHATMIASIVRLPADFSRAFRRGVVTTRGRYDVESFANFSKNSKNPLPPPVRHPPARRRANPTVSSRRSATIAEETKRNNDNRLYTLPTHVTFFV